MKRKIGKPGPVKKDLVGRRFGRLLVLSFSGVVDQRATWECLCDCGEHIIITRAGLVWRGRNRCKKCRQRDGKKHGETSRLGQSREYATWAGIIQRCTNPNNCNYRLYGGRGIKICARWRRDFRNFLQDMGRRPGKGYSIERLNDNGNYNKRNCCWATRAEQNRNRRDNVLLTGFGKTQCAKDWAEELGVCLSNLKYRIRVRGMTLEEAVSAKKYENPKLREGIIFKTIGGVRKPLFEWVREYGVRYGMVYQRLAKGWKLREALTIPPRGVQHRHGKIFVYEASGGDGEEREGMKDGRPRTEIPGPGREGVLGRRDGEGYEKGEKGEEDERE